MDHVETVPYAPSNLSKYWQPVQVFESVSSALGIFEGGSTVEAFSEPDLEDCMRAIAEDDARSNTKQIAEIGSTIEGLSNIEDCMRAIAAEDTRSNEKQIAELG